jgi:hypothetical protein
MANHRETAKHLDAFETWYALHRDYRITSENLAIPQGTLRTWGDWFHWTERADKRDREAAAKAEKDAIRRRAEMLKRHRQAGELMTRRGIEFFAKKEIDRAQDATQAIKAGVELERQAEGMPTWVVEILNADEQQLRQREAELDARRRAAMAAGADSFGDALAVAGEAE